MHAHRILLPLIAAIAFIVPATAGAHQTSLKAVFIAVPAGASPVKFGPSTAASMNLSSGKGGTIKLKLKKAVDAGGGKITAAGNKLRMNVIVNGAAQTWQIPFDISNGNGKINNHLLGLVKPDIIQIIDMALEDSGGVAFGHFGFTNGAGPNKALASAMVQTEDGSFIRLAATRDADISLKAKHGAELKVRFDKLHDTLGNDINAAGNRLEVKTIVNGSPKTDNFSFDIINDSGEVDVSIPGLSTGDKIRIVSVEGFDPDNKRFSTLGVRIQNPPAP